MKLCWLNKCDALFIMLKPPLVLMHGRVSYGLEVLDGGLVMEKMLESMKIVGYPRENDCRIISPPSH